MALHAFEQPQRHIELRLSLDLTHPTLQAQIPEDVCYATVVLEPGTREPRPMSRSEGTMRFDADGEARLSWLHAANLPTVTFMARYAAGAGAAVIVPLETLELLISLCGGSTVRTGCSRKSVRPCESVSA